MEHEYRYDLLAGGEQRGQALIAGGEQRARALLAGAEQRGVAMLAYGDERTSHVTRGPRRAETTQPYLRRAA